MTGTYNRIRSYGCQPQMVSHREQDRLSALRWGHDDFECANAKVHARAPSLASVSLEASL